MSQPGEALCLQQFFSWAKSECRFSSAFPDSDEEIFFYSVPIIEEYFKARNHETLNAILAALFEAEGEPPPGIEKVIVNGYIAVFCILLYTGNGRQIKKFVEYELNDGLLPFCPTHPHPNFPHSSDQSFFEKFCEHQWRFCCPILSRDSLDKSHFHENRILPIADKQRVGVGGSAELFQIRIYDRYNQLHLEDFTIRPSLANTFVLKTYVSDDAEEDYTREVAAFQRLAGVGTPRNLSYIIGYYGSFTHGKKHNIILEYADKGDLDTYFKTVDPPQTAEDILSFWGGMFNLLSALMDIHMSKEQSSPDAPVLQGLHQDIKPQNILVVSSEETSPSKWLFKLGDFGLTQFQKSTSWDRGTSIESQGTRTYGAPECYRDDGLWTAQLSITTKADIWSLGCIYSEGARWVATGLAGLRDYSHNRLHETRKIPDFEDGNCFHDGEKALRTVRDSNKATISKLHEQDPITHRVLGMVDDMLDSDPEIRPDAKQLWAKAQTLLAEGRLELKSRVGHSATISSISSAASGNRPPPPLPPVLPYSFIPPSSYCTSPDKIDNQPTKIPSPPPLHEHIQAPGGNRYASGTPNPPIRSNTYSPSAAKHTPIPRSETTNGKMMESSYFQGYPVYQASNLRTGPGNFENRNREADTGIGNSHSRTGSVEPDFPSTSVSRRDSKNVGDSPNTKKSGQKTQPGYCFSAKGNTLVVWAKSARQISIYDVKGEFCIPHDAVDVRLAAAGEKYYTTVSETGNYESLQVHRLSDGSQVPAIPLESAAVSIAMSADDRFVALGFFNKVVVYNAWDLSEHWTHTLPPTDDRESKCERVCFSTDSSKILAARRTKSTVYPYISDCQTPTTTYKITGIKITQGHYQDFGVSSILHDSKSGFACVTAYAGKMPPTLFSIQSTPRQDSLDLKDLTDLGKEIQCAVIHPSPGSNQFMLVNSENNIFSLQKVPTGRWQVGKICKLSLNEPVKKSEMTVIAMPTPTTIYAFRIQGDKRILITVRIGDKKPGTSVRDISDKLGI